MWVEPTAVLDTLIGWYSLGQVGAEYCHVPAAPRGDSAALESPGSKHICGYSLCLEYFPGLRMEFPGASGEVV